MEIFPVHRFCKISIIFHERRTLEWTLNRGVTYQKKKKRKRKSETQLVQYLPPPPSPSVWDATLWSGSNGIVNADGRTRRHRRTVKTVRRIAGAP